VGWRESKAVGFSAISAVINIVIRPLAKVPN